MSDSINGQRCKCGHRAINHAHHGTAACTEPGCGCPSVVTPPAQDELALRSVADREGDGWLLDTVPAAPSVSTDHTDKPSSRRRLQLIPSSHCGNCGKQLAWRSGVGRIVITHATGDDRCGYPSPVAVLRDADREAAQAAMDQWDADLRAEQSRG